MQVLDLFCGAGGSAMGIHQSCPDSMIVGIDLLNQPNYPFEFIQGNAIDLLTNLIKENFATYKPDFIWASPPCQYYTKILRQRPSDRNRHRHKDLIGQVRKLLQWSGIPWVMENVGGSPLIDPIMLCGEMFNLRVIRHRYFESSIKLTSPLHKKHNPLGTVSRLGDGGYYYAVYGHSAGKAYWGEAMGVDWMDSEGLSQAIPPAYAEYITNQIKAAI